MSRRTLMAAGAFVIVAALAVGLVWRPWASEVPDDAAFVIGDRAVTVSELDRRTESLRALYGVQEPPGGSEQQRFQRQTAKSMAMSLVLEHAADKASIEVAEKTVDAAIQSLLDSRFGGDRQGFVDALGNVGTSEEEVREEIRRQLELRKLLDEVAGDVEISSAEVKAAFEERRVKLGRPQTRAVSNIVVASRQDATRVRRQLDAGADVATLARKVSADAVTRNRGGSLGPMAKDELVPAVGTAVFSTSRGRSYGPVKGPQGWNVGVVTRILPPKPATLTGVRKQLRTTLADEEAQRRWNTWLEERLRDADIEYAAAYRPEDPLEVTAWPNQAPSQAPSQAPGGEPGQEAQ